MSIQSASTFTSSLYDLKSIALQSHEMASKDHIQLAFESLDKEKIKEALLYGASPNEAIQVTPNFIEGVVSYAIKNFDAELLFHRFKEIQPRINPIKTPFYQHQMDQVTSREDLEELLTEYFNTHKEKVIEMISRLFPLYEIGARLTPLNLTLDLDDLELLEILLEAGLDLTDPSLFDLIIPWSSLIEVHVPEGKIGSFLLTHHQKIPDGITLRNLMSALDSEQLEVLTQLINRYEDTSKIQFQVRQGRMPLFGSHYFSPEELTEELPKLFSQRQMKVMLLMTQAGKEIDEIIQIRVLHDSESAFKMDAKLLLEVFYEKKQAPHHLELRV